MACTLVYTLYRNDKGGDFMSISNLCNRTVVCVNTGASIAEVAKQMEDKNVGSVVVVDNEKPCGLVTDRDIILRVVNKGKDPQQTYVDDVMSELVLCLEEDMGLYEALEMLKGKSLRRYPVIDKNGNLKGIITLDDIIYLLGREMSDVASIIQAEGANL
jgi:CBS domain-containing protein